MKRMRTWGKSGSRQWKISEDGGGRLKVNAGGSDGGWRLGTSIDGWEKRCRR